MVACCLAQINDDGKQHPVAFASKKLNGTQANWSTIEKEAFAVVWSLTRFHNIIWGSSSITVFSDHDPLRYLINNVTHSSKLTRWALAIQQYDVRFEHIKGKLNVLADGLSRMPSV